MMLEKLLRLVSAVLCTESLLMFVCMVVDIYHKDHGWFGFAVAICSALFVAVLCIVASFMVSSIAGDWRRGMAMLPVVWVVSIPFGVIPFVVNCPEMTIPAAILEFTSALTTVSLTVYLKALSSVSNGLLLWHTLLAGIGGIGLVLVSILVIDDSDNEDRVVHVARQEFVNEMNLSVSTLHGIAKKIVFTYLLLIVLCSLCYGFFGMSAWDSICTAITTVATSGFVHYSSIESVFQNDAVLCVATVFMLLGSLPLVLVYSLFSGVPSRVLRSEQSRVFFMLVIVCSCVILYKFWSKVGALNFHSSIESVFHTVSALTTTGFSDLSSLAHLNSVCSVLFLITLLGGCAGSTSGGIKCLRLIVAFKTMIRYLKLKINPMIITSIRVNGKPINDVVANDAVNFVALYGFTYVASVVAILLCRDVALVDAASLALSLLTTSGMIGTDVFTMSNSSGLVGIQIVSTVIMIIGRLELTALYILLFRRTWSTR